MSPTPTWKRGDRDPPFEAVLERDGAAYDLTGRDVRLIIGRRGAAPIVDATPAISDAAAGEIRYEWAAGDLDVPTGTYSVDVLVDEGTTTETTFPDEGHGTIRIAQELE